MIGVTLGDPAGVGPEVLAKSLASLTGEELVLIGNKDNFLRTISDLKLQVSVAGVKFVDIPGGEVQYGKVQKNAGEIAVKSIEKAVGLAKSGQIDSISTAP